MLKRLVLCLILVLLISCLLPQASYAQNQSCQGVGKVTNIARYPRTIVPTYQVSVRIPRYGRGNDLVTSFRTVRHFMIGDWVVVAGVCDDANQIARPLVRWQH